MVTRQQLIRQKALRGGLKLFKPKKKKKEKKKKAPTQGPTSPMPTKPMMTTREGVKPEAEVYKKEEPEKKKGIFGRIKDYFVPEEKGGTSEFGKSKVGQFFGYAPKTDTEIALAAFTLGVGGPLIDAATSAIGIKIASVASKTFAKKGLDGFSNAASSFIGKTVRSPQIETIISGPTKEAVKASIKGLNLINPKTVALGGQGLSKILSGKGLALIGAAAGSVAIGKWAQKEAPEPITFIMRDLRLEAEKTGNWDAYWEAAAARDELTELSTWEKIMTWTPFISPFLTVPKAINGIKAGGQIMDKLAKDQQTRQETGENEEAMWARVKQEQAEQEMDLIDYYNRERKKMVEWEREAKKAARNKDAAFWRKERAKQSKEEEEDRQAIADFWIAYRKEANKLAQDSRPSNLNFGLL